MTFPPSHDTVCEYRGTVKVRTLRQTTDSRATLDRRQIFILGTMLPLITVAPTSGEMALRSLANCGHSGLATCRRRLSAPTARSALEHVPVVQYAIQHRCDRGHVTRQFPQSSTGRLEVSSVLSRL